MRVLGISETCDLGSMYLRLLAEGHDVRVSVSNPLASGTMAGLVPRSADENADLEWIREAGEEGLVVFEAVGFGELQDKMRGEGFRVVGGSAFGDRLENDRSFAQQLLESAGCRVAARAEFYNVEDALLDLEARPRRCVLKLNRSAGETMIGALPSGRDIAAMLRVKPPNGEFMLMDYVEGVETGVGAFFNGTEFLGPACLDWEHKHFFAGDLGELTGEMGTVATFLHSEKVFAQVLEPFTEMFRAAGHVGWVNLNLIINEEGLWPLEFTCRFGYPGFAVLEPLQAIGWGDLLRGLVEGKRDLPTHDAFSVGIVLSTPPFPHSREEIDTPVGLPLIVDGIEPEHIHLGEVGRRGDELVTAGLYGWTAVVTGTGGSIVEARQAAYARAARVQAPNLRYRLDIGDKLIAEQFEQLVDWGWIELPRRLNVGSGENRL